jgi:Ca2+-dependent lipid-binding protein
MKLGKQLAKLMPRRFVLMALVLAWAIGYFGMSPAWLLLLVPVAAANAQLVLARVRSEEHYDTVWRLHHREWPTGESLHWLNSVVHKLWVSMVNTQGSAGEVSRKLNEVLSEVAKHTSLLSSLKISKLDFGDQPPLLSNVSVLNGTDDNEVVRVGGCTVVWFFFPVR